jgi:hypothetical protein
VIRDEVATVSFETLMMPASLGAREEWPLTSGFGKVIVVVDMFAVNRLSMPIFSGLEIFILLARL